MFPLTSATASTSSCDFSLPNLSQLLQADSSMANYLLTIVKTLFDPNKDLFQPALDDYRKRLIEDVSTFKISDSPSPMPAVAAAEKPRHAFLIKDLITSSDSHEDDDEEDEDEEEKQFEKTLSPISTERSFPMPQNQSLPAWIFCTRYSDRPSAGPRVRKGRKKRSLDSSNVRRLRTSFSACQLSRLAKEFDANR
ncbi:engrailed homeobox [Cichlidogyrus casuarinus]|uniref:Engrailed homeobox n=1 Tax=Cichlidogyrus casuarinus TaxID=1844966 RepID=A0ABD2PMI5_9PLAT